MGSYSQSNEQKLHTGTTKHQKAQISKVSTIL